MTTRRCALALLLSACRTVSSPPVQVHAPRADAAATNPATNPANDAVPVTDGPIPDVPRSGGRCEAAVTVLTGAEGYAAFYRQMLDADGIPVLASDRASTPALRAACRITRAMTAHRADLRAEMIARGARVAVMARDELTLDIPEHADLQRNFPQTDWNTRARGLGGTVARPATSCAEENLRCEPTDRYRGENILVHELAHGIYALGVVFVIPDFPARLERAFAAAQAAGRWTNTYAGSNLDEYFAEGAQSFFDTNQRADPPNGIHNAVSTRAALRAYDPGLYALLEEVFPGPPWTPGCP
ncbi:MAG: hypothetical protein U0325_03275 [Polyangiales bacterium]